jgi:hypothetical protein
MARLDGSGPENRGSKTGRGLGCCRKATAAEEEEQKLGRGMGLRRKAGGGVGKGTRLRSGSNVIMD